MAMDVQGALQDLIKSILGRRDVALSVVADTSAAVSVAGLDKVDATMTVADFQAQVATACDGLGDELPAEVKTALGAYAEGNGPTVNPPAGGGSSGSGSSGGSGAVSPAMPHPLPADTPLTAEVLQQQLQYVTYVTYEGDETVINEIMQEITEIDNSVNLAVDVDGDFKGNIDVETTNVNATGAGAVAAGETVENVVTGEGGVLIDGTNQGDIQTGDGSVQIADGATVDDTVINTGDIAGDANLVGDMDDSSIVSGDVGGDVVSIGDVDDASLAFGDGAQSSNVSDIDTDGSGDVNIGQTTGDGVTNVDTNDTATAVGGGDAFGDIDDAAVGTGSGDVANVSDLDDGSAGAVGGGDATGSDINDAFNDNQAPVNVEQGAGDQDVEQTVEAPVEAPMDDMEGMD